MGGRGGGINVPFEGGGHREGEGCGACTATRCSGCRGGENSWEEGRVESLLGMSHVVKGRSESCAPAVLP